MSEDAREYIKRILENSEEIKNATEEQIRDFKKKINFYGVVPASTKSIANLSIVNWNELYLRKLFVTAVVGYIYATLQEYDEYDTEELEKFGMTKENAIKYCRQQTMKFIKRNFEFNPDKHIRTAFVDDSKDPERHGKLEQIRKEMSNEEARNQREHIDITKLRSKVKEYIDKSENDVPMVPVDKSVQKDLDSLLGYISEDVNMLVESNTELIKTCEMLIKDLRDFSQGKVDSDDMIVFLNKYHSTHTNRLSKLYQTFGSYQLMSRVEGAAKLIPPVNVFYHLERYINNNYEQLRRVVEALYCEKPDIEFSIQYYKSFSGEDYESEAEKHRRSLESSIIMPVISVENGGWTILGPFKQNRERIDYYSKNTELFQMMLEQQAKDQQLGKELMKDTLTKKKRENIIEAGPDDPNLDKYREALGTIEKYGAEKVLSKEEKEKMADDAKSADNAVYKTKQKLTPEQEEELKEALTRKEMTEVPKDAIKSYVWHTDSEGNFVKKDIYIKAEAPKYIEDEYKKQSKEKIVKSKSGKPTSLADLKNMVKSNK